MHFSKTYAQILEGLPPGLRDNAIQYRQLKKIINQVVSELSSLGLSPELLQELIVPNGSAQDPSSPPVSPPTSPDSQPDSLSLSSYGSSPEADHASSTITLGQLDLLAAAEAASHPFRLADLDPLLFNQARVKYEVVEHSDRIEPHLRLPYQMLRRYLHLQRSLPLKKSKTWRRQHARKRSHDFHHQQSRTNDELKDLQNQLMQGAERRIDVRRKELEEWMAKCIDVEAVCMRYQGTRGEHQINRDNTRRAEEGTVVTEAAHHAKLEQLTTITNRLHALARTLGNAYFAADVLEPTAAAAVGDVEINGIDSNAPRDVTPERFLRLDKELVRGKAEVTKRLHQLSSIFAQIDWLPSELGIAPGHDSMDTDDPSYNTFALGASSNQQMSDGDPFLVSTPTPASRTNGMVAMLFQGEPSSSSSSQPNPESEDSYRRIFANFVARIEQADEEALQSNPTIPIGLENVELSLRLIEWAQAQHSALEEVKRKREAHIQAMYDQLEGLWRRLGVDESDMDAFVDMNRGSTEDTVRQYEEELNRMLELKQERMGQFVESAREEIRQLWDDLMVGEDERADFAAFADDDFTEELLSVHEAEIRKLREERGLKAPLLASIKKYFKICEEEKELAAAASDQTRLLGRGRDPGRLLREEKMRKRVQKEKPRLEKDLVAALPQWEQETGMLFLVYGESMIQALNETISQQEQENKSRPGRPGRSGSVPARATTPTGPTTASTSNSNSTGFVPGSSSRGNGSVTPAVRPRSAMASTSSSTQSVPNKRQRLVSSTASSSSAATAAAASGQSTTRVPLGACRGLNHAPSGGASSPTKISSKTPGKTVPKPVSSTVTKPNSNSGKQAALGHGRVPGSTTRATPATGGRATRSTSGLGSIQRPGGGGGVAGMAAKRFPSAGHAALVPNHTGTSDAGNSKLGMDIMKKASRAKRESFKPRPSLDRVEMAKMGSYGGFGGGGVREEEDED
ncbi:microtubule associated protein-domain-containing protein [Coprinopsis sp. MPI-PUGE-AT-0042]|nr:microtubule associated protein-domain-containing protein [Coprinopsis sp. MPI-PUGE-AT-0042]